MVARPARTAAWSRVPRARRQVRANRTVTTALAIVATAMTTAASRNAVHVTEGAVQKTGVVCQSTDCHAGQVRGDAVGGVPVEVGSGHVIADGGAGVGVAHRVLHVSVSY